MLIKWSSLQPFLLTCVLASDSVDPCQKLCLLDPDPICRLNESSFAIGGAICYGYFHKAGGRFCYSVSPDDLNCPRTSGHISVGDAERFLASIRRGPSPIYAASPVHDSAITLDELVTAALRSTSEEDRIRKANMVLIFVHELLAAPVVDPAGYRVIYHSHYHWFRLGGASLFPLVREVSPWSSFADRLLFKAYVELATMVSIKKDSVKKFLRISGIEYMCSHEPQKLLWLVTHDVEEWSERDLITLTRRQYLRNTRLAEYCPAIFKKDSAARSVLYLDRVHRALAVTAPSADAHRYEFISLTVNPATIVKSSFQQLVDYQPEPRTHFDVKLSPGTALGHGVVKEWFNLLSTRIGAMFFQQQIGSVFNLKPSVMRRSNWELELNAIGYLLALSFRERIPIALNLPLGYYAAILNTEVVLADIEEDDPILFQSFSKVLEWNFNNSVEFHLEVQFGEESVKLTQENKQSMIRRKLNYPPLSSAESVMLGKIREGFVSLLMADVLNRDGLVSAVVLRDVTAGQILDIEKLRETVQFDGGYSMSSDQIQWLFSMLEGFDPLQLTDFLKFITALPRVPLGGLASLEIPLTIRKTPYRYGVLPSSRTCFNLFNLPEYPTEQNLREAYLEAVAKALTMEE